MAKKLIKIDEEVHRMLKTLSYRLDREMGQIASECIREYYDEVIRTFQERERDERERNERGERSS